MLNTSPLVEVQRVEDPLQPPPHSPPPLGRGGLISRMLEGPGWTFLRLGLDIVMLAFALAASRIGAPAPEPGEGSGAVVFFFPSVVLALLAFRGIYGRKIQMGSFELIGRIVSATSLAAMLLIALSALVDTSDGTAGPVARMWVFSTAYLAAGRLVLAAAQRRARRHRVVGKATLIVGAGQVGAQVERRLHEQPELGLRPVGYLDADPPPAEAVRNRSTPVLGPPSQLASIAEEHGVEHVILAFLSAPDHVLIPIVRECEARKLEVSIVPRLFESINVRVALEHIGGLPLYGLRSIDPKGWHFVVKHAFDRLVAGLLVLFFAPLLIAGALAVKLSSPGPVFFRQLRIGRDGHEFEMLKFRTMFGNPDEAGEANAAWAAGVLDESGETVAAPVTERRTPVGKFLRRYSIDELPQLFNVLNGDMSLVGPRPELPHYVRLFEGRVHRYGDRHRVKSGVTGWAQVNGLRGNTSLNDRVEWDNYYIANWSLSLDLKILLMTIGAVVKAAE